MTAGTEELRNELSRRPRQSIILPSGRFSARAYFEMLDEIREFYAGAC